jgi:MFS family permease
VTVLALCHGQAIASFQILNILVDPIRTSLHISDTQYSLLQGFAVAIFSAALGIPAARWADRHSRRNVILAGAVGWSLATAACGFVDSFAEFFAARVAMGIGEVFLFPAALALIADIAPRSRLSIAIACFSVGGPVGGAAAMFGGGWLVAHASREVEGWRIALVACGLSGVLTAALLLTLVEPRRTEEKSRSSFTGVLAIIVEEWRVYVPVSLGMICLSLCAFAGAAWVPTALSRSYGIGNGSAGELTAASSLAGGILLTSSAGWLVDKLALRGDRASPLTVGTGLCGALAALVVCAAFFFLGKSAIALWLVAYSLLPVSTVLGGTAFQMITRPSIRAQVMAIYLLMMNILALSLGPLLVAFLTERVLGSPDLVNVSLAIVLASAASLGGLCLMSARRLFCQAADRETSGDSPDAFSA